MVVSTMPTNNCISCAREAPAIHLCQVSDSVTCWEDEPPLIKELLPELSMPGSFVKSADHWIIGSSVSDRITPCFTKRRRVLPPSPITPDATTTTIEWTTMQVSNILFMRCQVVVEIPQGIIKTWVLLDTGSSASFVTERLAQTLH